MKEKKENKRNERIYECVHAHAHLFFEFYNHYHLYIYILICVNILINYNLFSIKILVIRWN